MTLRYWVFVYHAEDRAWIELKDYAYKQTNKQKKATMGPGKPRSELSMNQLPAALSRSILLRLAPDSGCTSPAISFGDARDGVEVRARQGRVIHVVQRDVGRNRVPHRGRPRAACFRAGNTSARPARRAPGYPAGTRTRPRAVDVRAAWFLVPLCRIYAGDSGFYRL